MSLADYMRRKDVSLHMAAVTVAAFVGTFVVMFLSLYTLMPSFIE